MKSKPVHKISISLRPEEIVILSLLADREYRGNRSSAVQAGLKMLHSKMERARKVAP